MGVKTKLIFILVGVNILSTVFLTLIALRETHKIKDLFAEQSTKIFQETKNLSQESALLSKGENKTLAEFKSQLFLEKMVTSVALEMADFFRERERDLLWLSETGMNQEGLKKFILMNTRVVVGPAEGYVFDESLGKWQLPPDSQKTEGGEGAEEGKSSPDPDETRFHFRKSPFRSWGKGKKSRPLYKEAVFLDLTGKELAKFSTLDQKLKNVSRKRETYLGAEDYFQEIKSLRKGEVYLGPVIGKYVSSPLLGPYTRQAAREAELPFRPEEAAYAGLENPVGKRFSGIIRMVTPVYRQGVKTGYFSLALDHAHIQNFTESLSPSEKDGVKDLPDPEGGDYFFIQDHLGRTISHPRHAYIVGFNGYSGQRAAPWVDQELYDRWKTSGKGTLTEFLEQIPPYDRQSFQKRPSWQQMKEGSIGMDCRYLNFAPQCRGWEKIRNFQGSGSFRFPWNDKWVLTAAAAIPYSAHGGKTRRSIGQVVANLHQGEVLPADFETRIDGDFSRIFEEKEKTISQDLERFQQLVIDRNWKIIRNINLWTFGVIIFLIFIALWISNYNTWKIKFLVKGIEEFSKGHLDYTIPQLGVDEIGGLAVSINKMARELKQAMNLSYKQQMERLQKKWQETLSEGNEEKDNKQDKKEKDKEDQV